MAIKYRKYDPSNKPDTCLWCGIRLEHKPIYRRNAAGRLLWPKRIVGYRERGGYDENNLFCTLACGYQFGLAFAQAGQRLQPLDRTPQPIIEAEVKQQEE